MMFDLFFRTSFSKLGFNMLGYMYRLLLVVVCLSG